MHWHLQMLLLAPLTGLAAPLRPTNSLSHVLPREDPCPRPPTCHRRWRHHGAHLTFRLARVHTCCPICDTRYQPSTAANQNYNDDKSLDRANKDMPATRL